MHGLKKPCAIMSCADNCMAYQVRFLFLVLLLIRYLHTSSNTSSLKSNSKGSSFLYNSQRPSRCITTCFAIWDLDHRNKHSKRRTKNRSHDASSDASAPIINAQMGKITFSLQGWSMSFTAAFTMSCKSTALVPGKSILRSNMIDARRTTLAM
ncbi:hypothetical protein CLUG_05587 [Clavispora lusitaniae ATCC 42720]|uniref:Uncharacterized protein n=1 Tax=Clavispora lusitaniae (strain ATCC 42720) TaxID=306902 RepID=C4YBK9_CLAL4|nr:uncharacterized protein CLUG_05587 [Clavispora lusitaniae ATCC 42720]EEQ41459.1 hypothetical protein CLUG_05587 [Clavispora lusitaniae ATCC 42720]